MGTTPGTGGEVQEKTMPGFFLFFFFSPPSPLPIHFSEITPKAAHLNARGTMEMRVVLGEGSQTGDPTSLVETKLHCLEINLSAWSEWVVSTTSPRGVCPAALTGKTTGMWERSELVFTG